MPENQKPKPDTKTFWTIPNVLTLFRIALVPLFVWVYLAKPLGDKNYFGTVGVLVLSGITDILDGRIARHFHMVSDWGKLLDPIADKVTQGAVMLCLLQRFPIMWYPIGVLAVREILDFCTHMRVTQVTGIVLCAKWHGKLATVVLDSTAILHVVWQDIPETVTLVLVSLCVFLIVLSGILYTVQNVGIIRKYREEHKEGN